MKSPSLLFGLVVLAASALFGVDPASAQAIRTWVSGAGDDANVCSRTAPCKTFAGAISRTADGGQISCLDPGGFGAVTITKSMTIDCKGTFGGITSAGTSAVLINAPATAKVILRGLDLNGGGSAVLGLNGIRFLQGASLVVDDVIIYSNLAASPHGNGIWVATSGGTAQVSISNTTISNSAASGVKIAPTGGTVRLTITNSNIVNSGGPGVFIAPTGNAIVNTTVIGSALDGNLIGIRSFPASPAVSNVSISDSSASNNAGGVHASGLSVVGIIRGNISGNSSYGISAMSPAAVRVGSSMINGNTLGLSGPVSSYGNNQLHGNTNPGSSTPLPPGSAP